MSKLSDKINNRISELVQNGELTNDDMVSIIDHIGGYLNLQTISDYSKATGISYNGAKKCRKVVEIFNVKFVIDNL